MRHLLVPVYCCREVLAHCLRCPRMSWSVGFRFWTTTPLTPSMIQICYEHCRQWVRSKVAQSWKWSSSPLETVMLLPKLTESQEIFDGPYEDVDADWDRVRNYYVIYISVLSSRMGSNWFGHSYADCQLTKLTPTATFADLTLEKLHSLNGFQKHQYCDESPLRCYRLRGR